MNDNGRVSEKKFSIAEAAQVVGVSRVTIWRELKRGNLRAYKIGVRRVIGERHLEEYLRERELPLSDQKADVKAA